jgi:tryptophan synthase alpha chain
MSRIEAAFARRRARGQKALVVYLCVGDPSVEESIALARAALDAGADVLELGVPFSDPTADGPAIARASERAIAQGASLARTIAAAAELRATTDAPIVLFGYYNPILVRGERRVVDEVRAAGIDALLVVDLPPEEGRELREAARAAAVHVVPLLTPTSGPERVAAALPGAGGFVYYVSVTGVTGAAAEDALVAAARAADRLRGASGLPVVVGFGIDGPRKARLAAGLALPADASGTAVAAGPGADGVVVGTAVVRAIEREGTPEGRLAAVRRLVTELRAGLD